MSPVILVEMVIKRVKFKHGLHLVARNVVEFSYGESYERLCNVQQIFATLWDIIRMTLLF